MLSSGTDLGPLEPFAESELDRGKAPIASAELGHRLSANNAAASADDVSSHMVGFSWFDPKRDSGNPLLYSKAVRSQPQTGQHVICACSFRITLPKILPGHRNAV